MTFRFFCVSTIYFVVVGNLKRWETLKEDMQNDKNRDQKSDQYQVGTWYWYLVPVPGL